MTYQADFAMNLERAATVRRAKATGLIQSAKNRYLEAAKSLDLLAAQFEAGDFDQSLMGAYAAMTADPARSASVASAATATILRIGFEPGFVHPDDVLDTIIREAEQS